MPLVVLVAQLSHPPSKSGWLADDVILGTSFTSLSDKTKSKCHQISFFSFCLHLIYFSYRSETSSCSSVCKKKRKSCLFGLTEVEEAGIRSRSGVTVSWTKAAGGWTIRTQQVSKQVWSRGLPRWTHTGANARARSHPKWIKQVTCGYTDTVK